MDTQKWRGPSEWNEWIEWLSLGLHGRHRWRLPRALVRLLLASGTRTVSSWLQAANVSKNFSSFYDLLSVLGRKAIFLVGRLLEIIERHISLPDRVALLIDDTYTERYGPKVEGASL